MNDLNKEAEAIKPIWQTVKELEEGIAKSDGEVKQIRATMLVNFGPNARHQSLISEVDSTHSMVCLVCEHLLEAAKSKQAEIERLTARVKELEGNREAELKHLFGVLLYQSFRTEDDELVTVTSITETFADYGITE